jgi:2-polyprenyl-3-methyl-5-hydroxy-6-metoxy-1,4-benzoquinol methylase
MKSVGPSEAQVIRSVYNNAADSYDEKRLRTPFQLRFDMSERKTIRRYLKPCRNILEVGAGTGRLTNELINLSDNVTVVDNSPNMLAKLEQKYSQAVGDSKLKALLWDVYKLGTLPGYGSFDGLLSMRMLPHIEDVGNVISIMKGAVRPGGIMIFDFWNPVSYVYRKKQGASVYNNFIGYKSALSIVKSAGLELVTIEGAAFGSRLDLNLEFLGRTPLKRFAYSLIAVCKRPNVA